MQNLALFPPEARFVYLRTNERRDLTHYEDLHPSEQELVSRAVDKRKGEFGDARWCAHEALKELGCSDAGVILRGERGMPLWPHGYTGSLTHTTGFRAAVAAPTRHVRSMGLDAEPAVPLPSEVVPRIASPTERAMLRELEEEGFEWASKLLFCAKEATYKCWFPMTRRWLGFEDADIVLRTDGTFSSYILARPTPAPLFEGRWVAGDGYIIASVFVE